MSYSLDQPAIAKPELERRGPSRAAVGKSPDVKRRTLVTGGSGFIGQHLVAALKARGDLVRVLDLQPPADRFTFEFVCGSVVDRAAVRCAMRGVDCVYHLAAISHLWTRDKREYGRVNHIGTEIALSVAAEMNVRRFIHCSTEAILLPPRGGEKADETNSVNFNDMAGEYTRSKYLAEQVALAAAESGLPLTIVNPTIPIGPGDHNFTPPTAMLSLFIRRPPLFILDCTLNLVDVRDVVRGMLLAEEQGRIGERYLLGGENITLRELLGRVDKLLGRSRTTFPLPGFVALAAGKAAEWIANNVSHRDPVASAEGVRLALRSAPLDIEKARLELGYAPRPISKSLPDAITWLRNRKTAAASSAIRWASGVHQARF